MEFVSRKCKDSGYPSIRNMMYLWDTRTKTIEVMSHPPTQWEKRQRSRLRRRVHGSKTINQKKLVAAYNGLNCEGQIRPVGSP